MHDKLAFLSVPNYIIDLTITLQKIIFSTFLLLYHTNILGATIIKDFFFLFYGLCALKCTNFFLSTFFLPKILKRNKLLEKGFQYFFSTFICTRKPC